MLPSLRYALIKGYALIIQGAPINPSLRYVFMVYTGVHVHVHVCVLCMYILMPHVCTWECQGQGDSEGERPSDVPMLGGRRLSSLAVLLLRIAITTRTSRERMYTCMYIHTHVHEQ